MLHLVVATSEADVEMALTLLRLLGTPGLSTYLQTAYVVVAACF